MIAAVMKYRKNYSWFLRDEIRRNIVKKNTIAVAGTGYVGLSIATLLSQHHRVYAVELFQRRLI